MYDNFSSPTPRPTSALEVAIHAREMEKKQALMVADLRADDSAHQARSGRRSRGFLASLLSSLKIF